MPFVACMVFPDTIPGLLVTEPLAISNQKLDTPSVEYSYRISCVLLYHWSPTLGETGAVLAAVYVIPELEFALANAALACIKAPLAYKAAEFAIAGGVLAVIKEAFACIKAPLAYKAAELATQDGMFACKSAVLACMKAALAYAPAEPDDVF